MDEIVTYLQNVSSVTSDKVTERKGIPSACVGVQKKLLISPELWLNTFASLSERSNLIQT